VRQQVLEILQAAARAGAIAEPEAADVRPSLPASRCPSTRAAT
jgi:hypothetical protein